MISLLLRATLALLLLLAPPAFAGETINIGSGHQIYDETNPLAPAPILSFLGAGVVCVTTGGKTECTIAGGGSSGAVLDLGDDGGNDSLGITEFAITGDTNGIFSEPAADKLLINVANLWPASADVTCTGCLGSTEIANDGVGWLDHDYTPTLASNPGMNIRECTFVTEGSGGGAILCEGSTTADTETLFQLTAAVVETTTWLVSNINQVSSVEGRSLTVGSNILNVDDELYTRKYDIAWKTPAATDDILIGKVTTAETPVSLDCVAYGGSGLTTIDVAIDECSANGTTCAAIGATATMTAVDTNVADAAFTDTTLAAGNWLKASLGTVTWTTPGFVSCTLKVTAND